jgi:hypothetical protein
MFMRQADRATGHSRLRSVELLKDAVVVEAFKNAYRPDSIHSGDIRRRLNRERIISFA